MIDGFYYVCISTKNCILVSHKVSFPHISLLMNNITYIIIVAVTHVQTYVHAIIRIIRFIHTYIHHTYMYNTYIQTYIHTSYIQTYIHTYKHTYIHTNIHTYILICVHPKVVQASVLNNYFF